MFLIHFLKDLFKIIYLALWRRDRPSGLGHAKRGRPFENLLSFYGFVIRVLKWCISPFMEKLCNQYKCKSPLALRCHMTARFGDSDQRLAPSEPDRMVYSHVWVKFDRDRRYPPPLIVEPKCLLIVFSYFFAHVFTTVLLINIDSFGR